jgi:serine/threonine protein kinase
LGHPSLVSLCGWNVTIPDNCISLILRRVDGPTLSAALRQNLTLAQKRAILYRITCDVKCLHDNHILHRDLKCENNTLNTVHYPFIIDFGVAKLCRLQNQSEEMGSPLYQAPETYHSQEYSFPANIYSLGITLLGGASRNSLATALF